MSKTMSYKPQRFSRVVANKVPEPERCGHAHNGYTCTSRVGHKGDHEAHNGGMLLAWWGQPEFIEGPQTDAEWVEAMARASEEAARSHADLPYVLDEEAK